MLKTVILPRQARDEHRESSPKKAVFSQPWTGRAERLGGAETPFFSIFPMFVPSLSWQNDRLYI